MFPVSVRRRIYEIFFCWPWRVWARGPVLFDRHFSVRGDGREVPRQLDIFRRSRGYVIALKSRKEAFVSLSRGGEHRPVLDTGKRFSASAQKSRFSSGMIPTKTAVLPIGILSGSTAASRRRQFICPAAKQALFQGLRSRQGQLIGRETRCKCFILFHFKSGSGDCFWLWR